MRAILLVAGLGTGCKSLEPFDAPSAPGTQMGPLPSETAPEPPPPPPEREGDRFLLPPAQTDAYVFVANRQRDTLTRVEVATQRVVTVPTGRAPSLVRTSPDQRLAVVFNSGDDTLTLLDVDTLQPRTVPVRPHLNALEIAPDGAFAVLWRDLQLEQDEQDAQDAQDEPMGPDGLQAFNEVSFVRLMDGQHFPMALGFEPRMVRFTPDGRLAVVVTQGHLAAIDLTSPSLVPRLYELAPDSLQPPKAEEVVLSPDGSFAWVRPFGADALLVVDLATGEIEEVAAGDNPTDLDLSPDGQLAVAVARSSAELYVFQAQSPFDPPRVLPLPEGGYGSLLFTPTGLGVLYTTASPVERFAVWNPGRDTLIERSLVKPVASMAATPTGGTLLVFHTREDGPDTEPLFSGSHALTLVDLQDFRSNPLLLPAKPLGYANSSTGARGYFVMEGEPFLEVLDYQTLLHDQHPLASKPEYVGVLPDLAPSDGDEPPAWVSQEHELGRLSFFDPDDGSLETLTGFELNAGVE